MEVRENKQIRKAYIKSENGKNMNRANTSRNLVMILNPKPSHCIVNS